MAYDATKMYTRVEEALKRKNYDLAIEMLKNQLLRINPNDVKARKLLRGTVLEKHKVHGKPGQGGKILPLIKVNIGKIIKKWDMVIDEAENFLKFDPTNATVLLDLGKACVEAGYIPAAICVFEGLLSFEPNNVNGLRALGDVYRIQEHEREPQNSDHLNNAKNCYERMMRLQPQDAEVSKIVKELAAGITSITYASAKSSKDLIRDKDKAKELEEDQAIWRTEEDVQRAVQRLEKKLETNPDSKKDLKKLGEASLRLKQFDKAIAAYQKVLKLDPTMFDIQMKIGECKIIKLDSRIKRVREAIKKNPQDNNLRQELQKVTREKIQTEIQEYQAQVKVQPTNSQLRFKLGRALFYGKKFDEAISNFQLATKDPRQKSASMNLMAQAFVQRKEFDLAFENFNGALEGLSEKDDSFKDIVYNLANAYEVSGNKELAIENFTKIYRNDIGYKDVKKRLEKLKA